MFMQLKKFNVFLVVMIIFYIGCKSYEIPYQENLKNATVNADLYVDKVPEPNAYFSGFLKELIHKKAILEAYSKIDLRDLLQTEFSKNGATITKRVVITENKELNKEIVPLDDKSIGKDPREADYKIEGISSKIGKDYLFSLRVRNWGFRETTFGMYSFIEYAAFLVDLKDNKKVWQRTNFIEASYGFVLTFGSAKDEVEITKTLHDCALSVIKDISKDINK